MAANRFTRFQPQQYVSTAVPLPFDEILRAGAMKQAKHDKEVSNVSKAADEFSQVETRPIQEDIQAKNKIVSGYIGEVQDIVSTKYGGNYAAAQPEISRITSKYASSPFWQYNKAYVDQYKKAKTEQDKLTAEGKQMVDFDSSIFNKGIYDEQGNINKIGFDVQSQLNHGEIAEKLANDLKASLDDKGLSQYGLGYLKDRSVEELSKEDIANYASNPHVIEAFKANDPQYVRILKEKQGVNDDDHLNAKIGEFIYGNIIDKKIKKDHSSYLKDLIGQEERKKKADLESDYILPQSYNTDKQNNPEINTNDPLKGTSLEGIKLDKSGNPIAYKEMKSAGRYTTDESGVRTPILQEQGVDENKVKEQVAVINQYRKENPALANMSNQDVINTIAKARQNSSQLFYNTLDLAGLDPEKLNKSVLGTSNRAGFFEGKQFDILGETNGATKDEVYEKLGLSDEDLKKQLSTASINGISPIAGKSPGSYQVNIFDSEGKPKTLLIAGSDQQKEAFKPSFEAAKFEKEGKTGINEFSAKGNNYIADTKLIIDPQTNEPRFVTKVAIYSKVGSKEDTKKVLDNFSGSKQAAEQAGYVFNKDGNVVKTEKVSDGKSLMYEDQLDWLNSPYMKAYKSTKPKTTFDIGDQQD
jgi:hypothetical protein